MIILRLLNTFTDWLENQTREVRNIVTDNLNRLRQGNTSNCKYLRDGISELRIHCGKGIRIYYTKRGKDILILLYGGADKKNQKKDIEKAIRIKEGINEKNNN
jgi:putative addiction module killer protein